MANTDNPLTKPYSSTTLPVLDLLSQEINGKTPLYNIPIYQRYYTWGEQQVKDLLDDLREAMDSGEAGFFLGPVLFRKEEAHDDIIDGQQRILSISIVISHIMHVLADSNKYDDPSSNIAKTIGLAKSCLWRSSPDLIHLDELNVLEFEPRIKFSAHENDTSYQFIICKNQTVGGSSPLAKSFKVIEKYFNGKEEEELLDYLTYLIKKTFFIVIKTAQSHSINKIFETLNDRGLPLNQVELFKNFMSGYVPVKKFDDDFIQKCYLHLNKSTKNLERFFWVYSLSLYGHGQDGSNKVNTWYRYWKRQILQDRNKEIIQEKLRELAKQMSKDIIFYKAILSQENPYWLDDEMKEFSNLVEKAGFLIKYKITHPLLFALIKQKSSQQITAEEFYQCLTLLYVFLARLWLVYGLSHSQQAENLLVSVAHKITVGKMKAGVKEMLLFMREYSSDKYSQLLEDDFFIKELKVASYSLSDQRPKFIFSAMVKNETVSNPVVLKDLCIHYVLPQDISFLNNWKSFDQGSHTECKSMLGNMVMLESSLNKKILSEATLENKKDVFALSSFKRTAELADKRVKWKPEKIKALQKDYAQCMAKILSVSTDKTP